MSSFRNRLVHTTIGTIKKLFYKHDKPITEIRKDFRRAVSLIPKRFYGRSEALTIEGVHSEWIYPPNITSDGIVLYFHGGGYTMCGIDTHRAMVSYIANFSGCKILMIDYRLAPEHRHPACIEDAVKVYGWLLNNGYSHDKIVFGGDSAGGGLTIASMLYLRDKGFLLPKAAFCMSPWLDLTASGNSYKTRTHADPFIDVNSIKFWVTMYTSPENLGSPYVSPIFADLSQLPPIYIQVGDAEILLSDSEIFAEKAQKYGVNVQLEVWPHMVHVWQMWTGVLPEATKALHKIGNFVKKSFAD